MQLKKSNNCSLFLTAGYPHKESALEIVPELEAAGVDLIELGIPFSDPLADGTVIQQSSAIALKNGMNIDLIFEQLIELKGNTKTPIVLMGYFNPVYKYGLERFLKRCAELGVDGLIIPDLTIEVYEENYLELFEKYQVPLVFLITPNTPEPRIRRIEKQSKAFIYLVSSSSITGGSGPFGEAQKEGFERIKAMALSVPVLVGFGIHNKATFDFVCAYFDGAIIGSAFIKSLEKGTAPKDFVNALIQGEY